MEGGGKKTEKGEKEGGRGKMCQAVKFVPICQSGGAQFCYPVSGLPRVRKPKCELCRSNCMMRKEADASSVQSRRAGLGPSPPSAMPTAFLLSEL